ncbi:hypothetical protein, partial [Bacillus sp. ISL-55]|uniref:hypothetical protein n=1 Tax=Bacillus sp. ISL-55 TaxID=2819134 RepID=UPI001BE5F43E
RFKNRPSVSFFQREISNSRLHPENCTLSDKDVDSFLLVRGEGVISIAAPMKKYSAIISCKNEQSIIK